MHKPQPKYGWHPSTTSAGFVDEHGVTIGSRVYHADVTDHFGVVIDGPLPGFPGQSLVPNHQIWMVNWEPNPRTGAVQSNPSRHTVGTLRLAST